MARTVRRNAAPPWAPSTWSESASGLTCRASWAPTWTGQLEELQVRVRAFKHTEHSSKKPINAGAFYLTEMSRQVITTGRVGTIYDEGFYVNQSIPTTLIWQAPKNSGRVGAEKKVWVTMNNSTHF